MLGVYLINTYEIHEKIIISIAYLVAIKILIKSMKNISRTKGLKPRVRMVLKFRITQRKSKYSLNYKVSYFS